MRMWPRWIRRFTAFVGVAVGLSVIGPWAGVSWAGGGCHTGVTQGSGDVVEIVDACFTPTTLRIQPGDQVTFVNRDPMVHNVVANGWGHFEDMSLDDRFSVTFDDEGVYPFACTYHPGMTGAVVVGDGSGSGNGAVVDVALPQDPAPEVAVASVSSDDDGLAVGWVATVAIALAVGLGAGIAVERGRGGGGVSRTTRPTTVEHPGA